MLKQAGSVSFGRDNFFSTRLTKEVTLSFTPNMPTTFLYEDAMGYSSGDEERIAHLRMQEGSERMQPLAQSGQARPVTPCVEQRVARQRGRVHGADKEGWYRFLLVVALLVMVACLAKCRT